MSLVPKRTTTTRSFPPRQRRRANNTGSMPPSPGRSGSAPGGNSSSPSRQRKRRPSRRWQKSARWFPPFRRGCRRAAGQNTAWTRSRSTGTITSVTKATTTTNPTRCLPTRKTARLATPAATNTTLQTTRPTRRHPCSTSPTSDGTRTRVPIWIFLWEIPSRTCSSSKNKNKNKSEKSFLSHAATIAAVARSTKSCPWKTPKPSCWTWFPMARSKQIRKNTATLGVARGKKIRYDTWRKAWNWLPMICSEMIIPKMKMAMAMAMTEATGTQNLYSTRTSKPPFAAIRCSSCPRANESPSKRLSILSVNQQ
mmetsp:Transcript_29899/g.62491  ORF Transcript_29899/g.62491 Transcript_29899/m.62491 type:complete len:310 (+) Transcript_29899:225-1154(+)